MYYRLFTLTLLQLQCYFINTQELTLLDPDSIVLFANKHGQKNANGGDIDDIERRSKIDNSFVRLGRAGAAFKGFDDDFGAAAVSGADDYFSRLGRGGGEAADDGFVRLGKSDSNFIRLGRTANKMPVRGVRVNDNGDNFFRIGKRTGYDDMDDAIIGLWSSGNEMGNLRRFKRNQFSTNGKSDKVNNDEVKKDHSNNQLTNVKDNKKKCPVFVHA